jgi:hypothetical protein
MNMDQLWRKNKLKDYFKNLKGQTWKSRRREKRKGKKKVIGVKSGVNKSHALPRDGGTVGMIW